MAEDRPRCWRCNLNAIWAVVGEHEEDWSCSGHLAKLLKKMTEAGWVKVDRVQRRKTNA